MQQVESVEVLNKKSGEFGKLDKSLLSWRGAAIAANSDAAKDMYILQSEWHEGGTRFVREKAPFGFS